MSEPLDLRLPPGAVKSPQGASQTPQSAKNAAAGFLKNAKDAYDRLQQGVLTPGGFHLAVTTDLQNFAVGLELSKPI